MKKALYFFTFFLFLLQGQLCMATDVSQLPLVVRNLPEWEKDHLTVINNWGGKFITSIEGELPPVLAVITAINGKDTRGMNETDFNNIVLSQSKCDLTYLTKQKGKNIPQKCTLHYHQSIYWAEGVTMTDPEPFPDNISMKNQKGASVFSFNTFAFRIGKIKELNEEEALKAAGKSLSALGFVQVDDENSADMILELSTGKDEFNGTLIELNIYDGQNLKKDILRSLWTLDIKNLPRNVKEQESAITKAFFSYTSNFPFDLPSYSNSISTLGVAFESESTVPSGQILEVLKGSDAYSKGLRGGDAVVGAYNGSGMTNLYWIQTRRYYFKPNKKDKQANWGVDLLLFLPIIPQYTKNNAYHYLTDDKFRGDSHCNYLKIRQNTGRKIKINAPLQKTDIIFKYIK